VTKWQALDERWGSKENGEMSCIKEGKTLWDYLTPFQLEHLVAG
jgi:hypothetical protein